VPGSDLGGDRIHRRRADHHAVPGRPPHGNHRDRPAQHPRRRCGLDRIEPSQSGKSGQGCAQLMDD
nr:hypothetical protein [Tanacetum cinerariifolium]